MNTLLPAIDSISRGPSVSAYHTLGPSHSQSQLSQGYPGISGQCQRPASQSYPVLSGLLDFQPSQPRPVPPANPAAYSPPAPGSSLTPLKPMSPVYPQHYMDLNMAVTQQLNDLHRSAFRPVFPRLFDPPPHHPRAQYTYPQHTVGGHHMMPYLHVPCPIQPSPLPPPRVSPRVKTEPVPMPSPSRSNGLPSPKDHKMEPSKANLLQLVTNHLMSSAAERSHGRASVHSASSGSEKDFEDPTKTDEPIDYSMKSPKEKKNTTAFDGTSVLCQVCGDKASGFHYGVHACEGCKGFYRRSLQQKLQYRPCTKDQQCSVLRINRNRCQYCRLKKCIAVGMSRDGVRYGRVPKTVREKMKLEMQKANVASQVSSLTSEMENTQILVGAIVAAHVRTSEQTRDRFLRDLPADGGTAVTACPLAPTSAPASPLGQEPSQSYELWQEFNRRYSPTIEGVVDFAKSIPGFHLLPHDDQVTLLKSGVFEVLLLRLSSLVNPASRSMRLLNGSTYARDATAAPRFLLDSLFDFVHRLNSLLLTDSDIALFSAVVLVSPDRPGLRSQELVESMHRRLVDALGVVLQTTHPGQPGILAALMQKVPDLKTLNTLHTEKLLAFKMEPREKVSKSEASTSNAAAARSGEAKHLSPGKCSLTDSGKGSLADSLSDHHHSSDSEGPASCSPGHSPNGTRMPQRDLPALKKALQAPLSRIEQPYGLAMTSLFGSPRVTNTPSETSSTCSSTSTSTVRQKYAAVASLLEQKPAPAVPAGRKLENSALSSLLSAGMHAVNPLHTNCALPGETLGVKCQISPLKRSSPAEPQEEPLNLSKKPCLGDGATPSPNSLSVDVGMCSLTCSKGS